MTKKLLNFMVAFSIALTPAAFAAKEGKKIEASKTGKKKKKDDLLTTEDNAKGKASGKLPRSNKSFGVTAGGEYLGGIIGASGDLGIFISPNFIAEGGVYYGGFLNKGTSYIEGRGAVKYYLVGPVHISAGAGYGVVNMTHVEFVYDDTINGITYDDWKEAAGVLRPFGAVGATMLFGSFEIGGELSFGFNVAMSKPTNNIPLDEDTNEPVNTNLKSRIPSGMAIGAKGYIGFAF